jgi:hypothetical protein
MCVSIYREGGHTIQTTPFGNVEDSASFLAENRKIRVVFGLKEGLR